MGEEGCRRERLYGRIETVRKGRNLYRNNAKKEAGFKKGQTFLNDHFENNLG